MRPPAYGRGSAALVLALVACVAIVPRTLTARDLQIDIDAPRRLSSAAERLRTADYSQLARSLDAAGLQLPSRIRLTLVANDDERVARIPRWVVGLASGTEDVVVFPERVGPYPYDSLESVMRHEIVHLALNARAGGRALPRWFHEGTAVTLESGWSTRDELRLLLAALDPPSLADIGRLFTSDAYPDTTQAYLLSGALVDEIRRRHGPDVIGRIAGGIADGQPFDAAFEAATGETVDAAAERAWRGHRRLSRWVPVLTSPSAAWTLILFLAGIAFVVRLRKVRELRRRWDEEEEEDDAALPEWHEEPDDGARP